MSESIPDSDNDEIPAEVDFASGERGKFFKPGARFNLPVYLDAEVQSTLSKIAEKNGVQLSDVANELLKKEIALLEAVK
jgi:hypothetical protein